MCAKNSDNITEYKEDRNKDCTGCTKGEEREREVEEESEEEEEVDTA